jgi:MOSC domain-containing protein YiiM
MPTFRQTFEPDSARSRAAIARFVARDVAFKLAVMMATDILPEISSVQTGKVAPLGPEKVPSGMAKTRRDGAVAVGALGLDGDAQADLSVHGGPDKAVYGYAGSRYAEWARDLPRHAAKFLGGGMGENLTIAGMDERALCVGDVHAIGSALLQVCQPRQPCFKLALYYDDVLLPRAMVKSGRSGWYYRVLQPGTLKAGDAVSLADRPHPDFAFTRLVEIVYHGGASREELRRMTAMDGLALQWRRRAGEALEKI